eukprot:3183097-Amphidinium_carterae.2
MREYSIYYMELSSIDDIVARVQDLEEDAVRQLNIYQNHMSDVEDEIWRQLEEQNGKLVDTNDYIVAIAMKDEELMKKICYRYFNEHRALRQVYDANGEQINYRRN